MEDPSLGGMIWPDGTDAYHSGAVSSMSSYGSCETDSDEGDMQAGGRVGFVDLHLRSNGPKTRAALGEI